MKVVNMRKSKWDVRVDRMSRLGNPYRIGKDGNRKEVIAKYRKYLWRCIKGKNEVYKELIKLSYMDNNTRLGCWCKPKACHGDIIVKAINWLKKKRGE